MPPLLTGHLHIWLTQLDPAATTVPTRLLAAYELAHAQKFRQPDARRRYQQIRASVRGILASYAGVAPQDLVFERSNQGKPFLANAKHPINFNLSHSGNYLALALSADKAVGIDIERTKDRHNWRAIAERYFHPDELAQLVSSTNPSRDFYCWWTLKEAFFKARGTGIATGLDKAIFYLDADTIHCRFADELKEDSEVWRFQLWRWNLDHHLALAWNNTDGKAVQISFFNEAGAGQEVAATQPGLLASSMQVRPA